MKKHRIGRIIAFFILPGVIVATYLIDSSLPYGLAAAGNIITDSTAILSQCSNSYCTYLPLAISSVPEVDAPQCRWPHNPGQLLNISYKWGDRLQTPGTLWRNAFETGLSTWNGTITPVLFYYSSSSSNSINTYYDETSDNRGISFQYCSGATTTRIDMLGNIFYDIRDHYTTIQRRGIATHELGHGTSIGHIPNEYPRIALMYKFTPLEFFDTTYTPQLPDMALVNQIYP